MILSSFLVFPVTLFLIPLFIRMGRKVGLVVEEKEGIPLTGGWLLFLVVFPLLLSLSFPFTLIIAMGLVFLMGLWDDFRELSPLTKILIQSVAALLVILSSLHTTIARIPLFFNYLITFLWIVGIVNAFNFLDIMDGLSPLMGTLSLLGICLVAGFNKNSDILILSLGILSFLLAFLLFNFPPARIFLGNSGSYLLGFFLGFMVIPLSFAPPQHEIALLTPLLLLGLPLLDTFYLILRRWKEGKPVYRKSKDHLALVLRERGWEERKVLLFMGGISSIFVFSGVLITRLRNLYASLYLVSLLIIVLFIFKKLGLWRR